MALQYAAHNPDAGDELRGTLEDAPANSPSRDEPRGRIAPLRSGVGVTSLVRDASVTNTNYTTEIDPSDVAAETLLLWGAELREFIRPGSE